MSMFQISAWTHLHKKLFVAYLKFKIKWNAVFLCAKSGHPTRDYNMQPELLVLLLKVWSPDHEQQLHLRALETWDTPTPTESEPLF